MATTFRQDITAGLVTILDYFIVAHPTLLRRSERAQPPSVMGDLPLAFVDSRTEQISHTSGIRERVMVPSVVVVSPLADNVETVVRHDVLVDLLVDHFTRHPHVMPVTIWDRMAIDDEDYSVDSDDGTTRHFYATRFTFGNLSIMEGRSDPGTAAHLNPLTATYEAIALALNAVGLVSIANPPGATAETIAAALVAAGLFEASVITAATTGEALVNLLIAAGLMAAS
jgi:hypothetical protein